MFKPVKDCCMFCMLICFFLCKGCWECIFPLVYFIRVVEERTNLPLGGARLEMELRDERMLLPGYPRRVGLSDSHGIIRGRYLTTWLGAPPTYHLRSSIIDERMIELRERRSVLGLTWLIRWLFWEPQTVTVRRSLGYTQM